MTIAVACRGKEIAPHFGHCEGCIVYYVKNLQIIGEKFIKNPLIKMGGDIACHREGTEKNSGCACRFFASFLLHEIKVDVVVAEEIGGVASQFFARKGIEVITGVKGEIERNVQIFVLKSDHRNYAISSSFLY